jgi:hypothetical protein
MEREREREVRHGERETKRYSMCDRELQNHSHRWKALVF